MQRQALILLDRDGVLNEVVVHPEFGTVDSPLNVSEVRVFEHVPAALARLTEAGFTMAIVTNQPAAAKGKTTRKNLEEVHAAVLRGACALGGTIASSHICYHRSEDRCACRKPGIDLLKQAFAHNFGSMTDKNGNLSDAGKDVRNNSWMVGDGITDVQAGMTMGLKTAFLGPHKCDACKFFLDKGLKPDYWGTNLADFVDQLLKNGCDSP